MVDVQLASSVSESTLVFMVQTSVTRVYEKSSRLGDHLLLLNSQFVETATFGDCRSCELNGEAVIFRNACSGDIVVHVVEIELDDSFFVHGAVECGGCL